MIQHQQFRYGSDAWGRVGLDSSEAKDAERRCCVSSNTAPIQTPPDSTPAAPVERCPDSNTTVSSPAKGIDPFDEVEWEIRSAVIGNEKGEVVFEQRDVEIPKFWSQQATNIVVSKYFRGQIGTPERERSVKQLIGRVVDTITGWARDAAVLRERR